MEYFAKNFFQRSIDLYFQRSLDLHDPAHRAIFEVLVDTDAESTLDSATRQWMLMPRAKHISSKFCRNLEYAQHLLETDADDQLRLLFVKPINVDNLYQRAKYKHTNSSKHKKVQDVDCQTDAVLYSNGTCQTQTCTSEKACLTEIFLEEIAIQTEVSTTETGNQTATATGNFAVQTEFQIKEIACQTQIFAEDIGIQTATSTDECSIQTVIDAEETACQTEIYTCNSEAASQTENETRRTAQTNTKASRNDQQPESFDNDTVEQLTAGARTKDRKVCNSAEGRENKCEGSTPGRLLLFGESDSGGGGDNKNSGQEDALKSHASINLFFGSHGLSYERDYTGLSLGLEQIECLRYVEMPDIGKSLSIGRLSENGRGLASAAEDAPLYNICPNYDDDQPELSNVLPMSTSLQAVNVKPTTPESPGRCTERTQQALDIDRFATCTKQDDKLSRCSGISSVLTSESTEPVAAEILALDDCSRRSPSAVIASVYSAENCSKFSKVTAPEVAAPTSVLPAVPEIPSEQLAVKYTLGKSKIVLGAGTYGTVYLVSHVPTNTTVVCKEQYLATSSYESILREASIQLYLHATNRVPFIYGISTSFGEAGTACIFQQYHNNCPTVEDLLKLPAGYIAKKEWVELAFDICAGLADIHQMGVLHNDIKANNLIVVTETPPYKVKFIDFGLASDTNGIKYNSDPADAHKYPHLAPETFYHLPTTVKSDVYSTGYVLKLINEIVQSPIINSMTERCFKEDPGGRPSLENITATLNCIFTSIFFT